MNDNDDNLSRASHREEVRSRISRVMRVKEFGPPTASASLDNAQQVLNVRFPDWLAEIYLACDGFRGPTGVRYLLPLGGDDGLVRTNMFTRSEDWAPDWVHRAILFGNNGIGGTIGSEWAWLDDQLIEWCMGDGADYTVLNYDVFELWQREQAKWDAVGDDPTSPLN